MNNLNTTTKLPLSQITDFSSGVICDGVISESKRPLTSVVEAVNMHFDKIGAAKTRLGTTLLGAQITDNTSVKGLYEFRDSGSGTNNRIVAVCGTVLYYLSSGTWTSKRTSLTANKARFTTFLDFLWMVNGAEATAIWDGAAGNSFLTTGNAASAPVGKYIENFKGRVWISGNSTYPDRLYYTSLPSEESTPVVTWDTDVATGDWIDMNPSDGENVTGFAKDKNALLVFKNNHIYRVYSISDTETDAKINVGTYSQESIVQAKNGIYFHHPSGIYRYVDGNVQEISKPVSDFLDAIPTSYYDDVAGYKDFDHIYWSIGDVTVNGVAYANIVLRYTISSEVWTIYSYPTAHLIGSPYNDGTTLFTLVGDEDGNVLKLNTGLTDNISAIFYYLKTRPYTFDGIFSSRKNISSLSVVHKNGLSASLMYKVDDEYETSWHNVIGIIERIPRPKTCDIKGNKIYFKFQGSTSGQPVEFDGIEIFEINSEIIK